MKQIELKNGVHSWLNDLYVNGVENVNPWDYIKHYTPLKKGNKKLDNGIFSFSILPVVTCGGKVCEGCYDVKSMRYKSVRLYRYVSTSLTMHNLPLLKELILKQAINSRTMNAIRIHVGGDMHSQAYVDMWKEIAAELKVVKPAIRIYTYTKTGYGPELKAAGINVVRSEYEEGMNYGSMEYIKTMAEKYKGKLCIATVTEIEGKVCGVSCHLCFNFERVFFQKH